VFDQIAERIASQIGPVTHIVFDENSWDLPQTEHRSIVIEKLVELSTEPVERWVARRSGTLELVG